MSLSVDPASAVLVGTYATERLGQIIASTLESEGIPAALIHNGHEGAFPRLQLIPGAVGVFVSPQGLDRARAVAREIEGPSINE